MMRFNLCICKLVELIIRGLVRIPASLSLQAQGRDTRHFRQ